MLSRPRRKQLHLATWLLQVTLALGFCAVGVLKIALPVGDLAHRMPFVLYVPEWMVRLIGFSELAGAVGLVAPAWLRIEPWLTQLAAAGLAIIMALAAAFHLVRGEVGMVVAPMVLGLLASTVALSRAKLAVISGRSLCGRPGSGRSA